ncbi:hypothetical protein [Myxosarcina sp. GI1]|uniref:hypothetical protein n=1 Tax=Myxosarcina sp. GI1 TaxID=1541065 RepID=UPI0012E06A73|nr:hypothetical protein [Myxosarcina sp. GI1]
MIHVTVFATETQNSPKTPRLFLWFYKLSAMRSLSSDENSSRIFRDRQRQLNTER